MKFRDLNEFWQGVIIAVAVLGITKLVDYLLEIKRVRIEGKRWMAEVAFMLNPIQKQIESIDEFLVGFVEDTFDTPEISASILLSDSGLNNLNKSDLQRYLQRKYIYSKPLLKNSNENKEKALSLCNHIYGDIIINQRMFQRIEEVFNSYQNNASLQVGIFKSNLNEFQWKFADFIAEAEKNKVQIERDAFLNKLGTLISAEVYKFVPVPGDSIGPKDSMELFKFQRDFIAPAMNIMAVHRMDSRVPQINKYLNRCSAAITEIRLEKSYLTTNISNVKNRLEQLEADIRKDIDDVSSLKLLSRTFGSKNTHTKN